MAEISWIKLTINMFDDEKIRIIQAMPESDAIIIVWIRLLTLAGKTNDDGRIYIDRDIQYTEEILSTLFNKPLNTIRLALDTLKRFKMINTDDGVIVISNWEKHQNIEGMTRLKIQNAERQKRFRDRKKIEQLNLEELENRDSHVTPTLHITSHHAIEVEEEVEVQEEDIKDIMSSKSVKRIYDDSSSYFQLSQYLFSKMLQNNPEAKKPNYQLWADDILKMVELDGRTPKQVQGMIDWSQSDEFWKTNILSAKKLREKYDQMKVTANANYKKKPKTERLPDWAETTPDSKETPVDPEEQRKLNERIAKLKTSGKESTG